MSRTRRALALLALLGASGCAEMALPPGGPLDTLGPRVLSVAPDSLAVGVPTDAPFVVAFSEQVDHESVRKWLTLTPYRRIDRFDWEGSTVSVYPRGGWPPDTTISVQVGSGVLDRGLNPLGRPIRRTFATGAAVAPGVLAGTVRRTRERAPAAPPPTAGRGGEGPVGAAPPRANASGPIAFVWAYAARTDSLPDPARENPDYQAEVDASGAFRIDGVAPGAYRLFTIHDADRSQTYSPFRDYTTRQPDSLVITPGHAVFDTLQLILIDPKAPGRVAGGLAAIDTTAAPDTLAWGVIIAPASTVGDTTDVRWPPLRVVYQGRADRTHRYTFTGVTPGRWRVAAFRDLDRDGRWARTEPLGPPTLVRLAPADAVEPAPLPRPQAEAP